MATLPQSAKQTAAQPVRGSDKLMKAWKSRILSDESVNEIAGALEKSPAKVEAVSVFGGANPTGVRLDLRYDGDDGPWCGNDISFWLQWLLKHGGHGGVIRAPKIIINGIPWPDVIRVQLDFGQVENVGNTANQFGETGGAVFGG